MPCRVVMSEFDMREKDLSPNNMPVEEFVEQDVSDREIAKKAEEFINRGREILISWSEFQNEVVQKFLHRERRGNLSVRFQKAGVWFTVDVSKTNLHITWADNENALEEGGWGEEGKRRERLHSRSMSISYDEKPFQSDKPYGGLFYEGPEIKIPTRSFVMPANTRAVVEQIEKSFAELERL